MFSLGNPRKFSAPKITRYTILMDLDLYRWQLLYAHTLYNIIYNGIFINDNLQSACHAIKWPRAQVRIETAMISNISRMACTFLDLLRITRAAF